MSVVDADLTPNQRKTLNARRTFAATFSTPEEKSAHYRRLGEKAAAERLVLSGEDAVAFAEAMRLLAPLMAKLTKVVPDD